MPRVNTSNNVKTKPAARPARPAAIEPEAIAVRGESEKPQAAVKNKILDFVIISSLFLIFFLSPLFFTGTTAQGIGFEKMLLFYFLVLLGVVAWISKGIVGGEICLKRTPLDIPLVAFFIILVVSTFRSIDQQNSLIGYYGNPAKGLVAAIVFILFYYLLVNNVNAKRIKILFWSFVFSNVLVVSFSLFQLLGKFILPFGFTHAVTFNTIGSITSLSMYLIIILPLLAAAASQIKEIHSGLNKSGAILLRVIISAAILADITVLVFLNGFTVWLMAIVGIGVLLLFFLAKIVNIRNNNLIIPITVFFVVIIFLVLKNLNVMNLNLPAEGSLSRSVSWNIAKEGVRAHPFIGSGPSTFYYDFSKFKPVDFNNSPLWNARFDSATGVIFELLPTLGILGALVVIIILFINLIYALLNLIKVRQKELPSILLALFSSAVSAFAFSFLLPLNNSLIILFILIFSLVFAVAVINRQEKVKQFTFSFQTSAKQNLTLAGLLLFVSASVVVMFAMGFKIYLADVYAKESLTASATEEKIEKLNKAISMAPDRDIYYIALANNYMALANSKATSGGNQTEISDNLNASIRNVKKALELSPNNVINNESLALIYENTSYYIGGGIVEWIKSLEDAYNKVIELDPNNPAPYFRLALINVARSNIESDQSEKARYINEAIKNYDKALAKKGNLSEAYYGKGVAYEKLSNLNEAIEQLKSAVYNSGQNIDYIFELGRLYFNRGVLNGSPLGGSETASSTEKKIARNDDINTAEQVFLNIIQANQYHANAQYSLALLYKTIGETEKARVVYEKLLSILQDEKQKESVREQFKDLY